MSKPFRPMKAVDVVDVEALKYPLVALTKYDGVYALVRDGKLLGRSLKPFKNEYITTTLGSPELEGFVGEICYGQNLAAEDLCRTTTSKVNTIKGEWDYTFVLFDYITEETEGLGYVARLGLLMSEIDKHKLRDKFNLVVAHHNFVRSGENLEEFYNSCLDNGFEGAIARNPQGMWKNGRSTLKEQGFLRMKPQSDKEAIIVGVEEAMENLNEAKVNELGYLERSSHQENKVGKGMVGAWLAVDLETGMSIKIGAGKLTHEERIKYFLDKPIGSVVKYRSMDVGLFNLPRFPRFISWRSETDMDEKLLRKVYSIRKELGCLED